MSTGLGGGIRGSIDAPSPGSDVTTGRLRVEGWALDPVAPLDRALVVAGADTGTRVTLGVPRSDVRDSYPTIPHAADSGLQCDLDLRTQAPGPLAISLLAQVRGGHWYEAARTTVNVVSAPAQDGRRPHAAFTIAKDEPVMLPLWVDYYGRHFAAPDLYVLDHDSSDGSAAAVAGRCNIVPVHRDVAFDHRWLRDTVEAFQAFLLRSYETVLFAEVDEFLVADPNHYAGLGDYLDQLERPAVRCLGYNVVHQRDEPPLHFDAPILAQRRHWHVSPDYCKRLVARVPLRWSEGFHRELSVPNDPPDPHLMLVHLHRVDYEMCMRRHRTSSAQRWSKDDIARGDGAQNRIADRVEFDQWFHHGPDLDAPREVIPEHIRELL